MQTRIVFLIIMTDMCWVPMSLVNMSHIINRMQIYITFARLQMMEDVLALSAKEALELLTQ
jgi:hypothetical protein